ncbi:acyl carrier protein [Streptomyces sp. NPDC088354]|uniref:acyl carrier protein n=1 Tax=unclassified Streptomyces TaxID=2593676 RepID=UPI0029BADD2A|nr:phosphopantetheine-binding protein [Streptomyces sp. MI02-7b]MDX3073728.1 phosphopantetheine-binding protein [Streptomyces sp. MI02-7b]
MTHDVAQIVRRAVAEYAGVPEDEVVPEATFAGLGLGDRGKQQAADAVERKVGVMLLADEVERMGTVGDLVDTVSGKLSEQLSSG